MNRPSLIPQILALAGKDWRLFWSDRRSAGLAFAVPIILASAFGLIFARHSASRTAVRLPVAVVVEGEGAFTRRIGDELLASPRLEAVERTREEAERGVEERRPGVAIVLPRGFEQVKDWSPGRAAKRPVVEILHHPTTTAERQWAEGVITEIVMKQLARQAFGEVSVAVPFQVQDRALAGTDAAQFNAFSHSFSGMALQYLLFWGMECGLLFLRERRQASWLRMRTLPVPLGAVLIGKGLASAAIAVLIVAATFGFGTAFFGVRIQGSLLGFTLLVLAAGGLAAATGLLIAAIGGAESRARSVSILVILGISMLGGLWMPAFLLPGWLRDLTLALPTTWAMRGLDAATWQGQNLGGVLKFTGVVAAFACVFLLFAVVRLASLESRCRKLQA